MHLNELQKKASEGDQSAREELFQRLLVRFHQFSKLKITNRDDAEDVAQSAISVVNRKFDEIEFEVSFAAWAHRVLLNEILEYYKKKGRNRQKLENYRVFRDDPVTDPESGLKNRLLDCLNKICPRNKNYARILNLHFQGFSSKEIGERLKIKIDHAYVVLSRARLMLEKCLKDGEV